MAIETVRGKDVVVQFNGDRCIHSRHCVLDRPDVFVPNVSGEWIHPERATPAELLELAHNCPSGAIRCTSADGSALETAPRVNTVRVHENGPLAFRAPLTIDGQHAGYRATLCRCGASTHKPYCDGSHAAAGFTASGEPAVSESAPLAQRDGALKVEPIHDGPLHVSGNLEVISGTGKTVNRLTETWLCRCGQSAKKPYCDGTHKKVGFRG
ncbi:MAG TPA: CDGSH iron-sulfur domain-containing protein [Burkholderiaceae bacterium]|nr:CDGSH iron-sulfur domain-containing protein [Burkholderiaceae bacterium]